MLSSLRFSIYTIACITLFFTSSRSYCASLTLGEIITINNYDTNNPETKYYSGLICGAKTYDNPEIQLANTYTYSFAMTDLTGENLSQIDLDPNSYPNYKKTINQENFTSHFSLSCKALLDGTDSYSQVKTIGNPVGFAYNLPNGFQNKLINNKIDMLCSVSVNAARTTSTKLVPNDPIVSFMDGNLFKPKWNTGQGSYAASAQAESAGTAIPTCVYNDGCFIWDGGNNDFLANTIYDNKLIFLHNLNSYPVSDIYGYIGCKDGFLPASDPNETGIKLTCTYIPATTTSPSYFIKNTQPASETCVKGCKLKNENNNLKNTDYEKKDYIGIIDGNSVKVSCVSGFEVETSSTLTPPSNFDCKISDDGNFSSTSDDLDIGVRTDTANRKSCTAGYIETKSQEITENGWIKTCETRVREVDWDPLVNPNLINQFLSYERVANVNVGDSIISRAVTKEVIKIPDCEFWSIDYLTKTNCLERDNCSSQAGCGYLGILIFNQDPVTGWLKTYNSFYIGNKKVKYFTNLAQTHTTKTCTYTNTRTKKIEVTTTNKRYCLDNNSTCNVLNPVENEVQITSENESVPTSFNLSCNNNTVSGLAKCIPSSCPLPTDRNFKVTSISNGITDTLIECRQGYAILNTQETGFLASCSNGVLSYKSQKGTPLTTEEFNDYTCTNKCSLESLKNINPLTTKIYYNQTLVVQNDNTLAISSIFPNQKLTVQCFQSNNVMYDNYEVVCGSDGLLSGYRGCNKTSIQCNKGDGTLGSTTDFQATSNGTATLSSNQLYTINCNNDYYDNTINSNSSSFNIRCLDGLLYKDIGGKIFNTIPKCVKKCKVSSISQITNATATLDGRVLNTNILSNEIVDPFSKMKLSCPSVSGEGDFSFVDSDGSYKKTLVAICKTNGIFGISDFSGQAFCRKAGCFNGDITFVNLNTYPLPDSYLNSYTSNMMQLECPFGFERFMTPEKPAMCKNGKWIGDKIIGCKPKPSVNDEKPIVTPSLLSASIKKSITININSISNAKITGGTLLKDSSGKATQYIKIKEGESITAKCMNNYYFVDSSSNYSSQKTYTVISGRINFSSLDKCRRFVSLSRLTSGADVSVYAKFSPTSNYVFLLPSSTVPEGTIVSVKCNTLNYGFIQTNSTSYEALALENGMFDKEYGNCVQNYQWCSTTSLKNLIDFKSIDLNDFNTRSSANPYFENGKVFSLKSVLGYNSPTQPICMNGKWNKATQAQLTKTPTPYRAFKNCMSDPFTGNYNDQGKLFNEYVKPYSSTKTTFMEGESIYLTCDTSTSDKIEPAGDYSDPCPNSKISGKCILSTCQNGSWSNSIYCHKWIKVAIGVFDSRGNITDNIKNKRQKLYPITINPNSLALAVAMNASNGNGFDSGDITTSYGTTRMYRYGYDGSADGEVLTDASPATDLIPLRWCGDVRDEYSYLTLATGTSNEIVENLKKDYPNKIKDNDGDSLYFSSLLLNEQSINLRCDNSSAYLALRSQQSSVVNDTPTAQNSPAGVYCWSGYCFSYDKREFRTTLDKVYMLPNKATKSFQITPNQSSFYSDEHSYKSDVAHLLYVHCLDQSQKFLSQGVKDLRSSTVKFTGYYACQDITPNNALTWGVDYNGDDSVWY